MCREWEELPTLPVAGDRMSAVELQNSLYAQICLLAELMQLPEADFSFPCFRTETEVYLVIKRTLYSFTPLKPIKTVPLIYCFSSYYSRGTLYYIVGGGKCSLHLGELTSL
jgi:hypothetical protein